MHVSIWENQGVNGTFRVASFELRYKKDEQWQTSHSYGASDLIFLENVAKSMTLATEKNGFHRGCHPPLPRRLWLFC